MRPRVLLLWPGTAGEASGNFGLPQLVGIASYLRSRVACTVEIRDLVAERALGVRSIERVLDGGYDVIAISVYSSFDWLLCEEIARRARTIAPEVVLVAGGYHASARPTEMLEVFDVAVVGEGERPLARVVESVAGGAPVRGQILGPEPIEVLDELPETDWSVMDRYRPIARRIASQAQLYLSRGCPFDCAFCMERAKREVSWRAFSVDRAVEEIVALHRWLDLRGWTLYVADALFGMKTSWRRAVLAELARRRLPIEKIWLLIRVDLVEDEDLALFGEANCALGFGLESGDPTQLSIIRKAGRLESYLDRMRAIASWARERNVPWGANVIVGHPGETRASMERSAAYIRELFLGASATTGFLSVDPFRLYPGSPIDAERSAWETRFGTRFHRPAWWLDGDPDFLAEWVDPSADLDYLAREQMQDRLFRPILESIEERFAYRGPARELFVRTIRGQVALCKQRLAMIGRHFAWSRWTGRGRSAHAERARHPDLASLCEQARKHTIARSPALSPTLSEAPAIARALIEVRRELFVPIDAIEESTRDVAIALDRDRNATVSAMHAYARVLSLAGLREGMRVLDLGAGTGYGTALAARLVGPTGTIHAVELDPALVETARRILGLDPRIEITCGDALDRASWDPRSDAVLIGFALEESVASEMAKAFTPGTRIVAPVVCGTEQRLARWRAGAAEIEWLEPVRYVLARRGSSERSSAARSPRTERTRLRVLG